MDAEQGDTQPAEAEAEATEAEGTEAEADGEETKAEGEKAEGEKPAKSPAASKRWKLKDGTREKEIASEEEALRYMQLGWAKDNRFEDSAKAIKERDQLVAHFKSNTREAMRKLGIDPRKFSEETLYELLEDEKLTPEQRELRDAKAKLKSIEDEKKSSETKAQEERIEKLTDAEADRLNAELPKLLASAGLPKSPLTLKRVAELWLTNDEEGLDVPLETLVELAREQYLKDIQELFGASDGDTLLKLLGEGNAKKIRKADLQRLKGTGGQAATKPARAAPAKGRTKEEFRAYMEKLKAQAPEVE